jgi:carboxyl-terminal processing protease
MLRFMKNKILIPLVITGALAAFFSFRYSGTDDNQPDQKKILVQGTIAKAIKEVHFAPRDLNDTFSARVYKKVLDELDYEKKFFTQEDINALKKYEFIIDDEIRDGSVEFFDKMDAIYAKRINDAEGYYKEILKMPFHFDVNESIQLNGEKTTYASNDKEIEDRWRKILKFRVLGKYVELKNAQDKAKIIKKGKGKTKEEEATLTKNLTEDEDNSEAAEAKPSANTKLKTDAELEVDARESVRKNMEYTFKRMHKIKNDERFDYYINAITTSEDPHTDYFPPKEKEKFDESMSGTFFGIGAQLREESGTIKIAAVITGSPCWKQGELKAGDIIVKVAQGAGEPVDITGYDIEDAVTLIRGKKGTEVRLTVKKVNSSIKVIPIVRGEVLMDNVFAKSAVIKSPAGPVGYIYLPEFYSDFQHINGRRCSEDVAKEVQKLKGAGVVGFILDLRNNGGGSLSDVVDMAGLFTGNGPVVQVKSSDAAPMTLSATNKGAIYDGPMAIMVNENSASASEIMAAAMQDYKRAVIVGSTSYGKGTVQKVIPLDEFVDPLKRIQMKTDDLVAANGGNVISSLGSLKVTVQKFYRVNGGSTQLKGVTPDIHLPDPYELINQGERHDKAALGWDEIARANFKASGNTANVAELAAMSKARVTANPTFTLIEQNALHLKKQEENNTYSLTETGYRKELDEANATSKKLDDLQKKTNPLEYTNLKEDMERINQDSVSMTKNGDWLKNLKKDIYISETVNIINDMAKPGMKMNNTTGMK